MKSEKMMSEKNSFKNSKTHVAHQNQNAKESLGDQATQELIDIQTLARLAGLERALERFPDDLQTAARTALKVRASFQASSDNTAEVWPVMQVKS
ncbi:MAG: hypothetical protein WAO93_05105 [Orrella sp.]|jgi:tryptophan 2,3-dioxygenase|uniref:hypothetical protein n=1 Tax=Orrella sp. TaxID=1921583 RepID=UPI003BCC930F